MDHHNEPVYLTDQLNEPVLKPCDIAGLADQVSQYAAIHLWDDCKRKTIPVNLLLHYCCQTRQTFSQQDLRSLAVIG